MNFPEGFSPDEEINAVIAGLPAEEQAEIIADRDFQEGLGCDVVPGIGLVSFAPEMTDEQKAQAVDYLRWLKERPDLPKADEDD